MRSSPATHAWLFPRFADKSVYRSAARLVHWIIPPPLSTDTEVPGAIPRAWRADRIRMQRYGDDPTATTWSMRSGPLTSSGQVTRHSQACSALRSVHGSGERESMDEVVDPVRCSARRHCSGSSRRTREFSRRW